MSSDTILEDVPQFKKRIADRVIQGSNNTIIILGTDRATNGEATTDDGLGISTANGEGKGTGTIHLVAGRKTENPNLQDDDSYIYISQKTNIDKNLDTTQEFSNNEVPSIAIKTNSVRIIARDDVKIINGKSYITLKSDGTIVLQGEKLTLDGEIHLGRDAQEQIIKGNAFKDWFNAHTHPTPVGPSSPPIQQMSNIHLSEKKFTK